jgi:hypothetical protein
MSHDFARDEMFGSVVEALRQKLPYRAGGSSEAALRRWYDGKRRFALSLSRGGGADDCREVG